MEDMKQVEYNLKEGGRKPMKKHGVKMIAPIIIAVIAVLYFLGISALFLPVDDIPLAAKILMIIIPLALAGVMIGVTVSRIKEIRSGEEDDLSKY